MEKEKQNSKGLITVIVILVMLVLVLSGYITYEKFFKETKQDVEKTNTIDKKENTISNEEKEKNTQKEDNTQIPNTFTNKSERGNYKVYMNTFEGSDSILILYSSKDNSATNEEGFLLL